MSVEAPLANNIDSKKPHESLSDANDQVLTSRPAVSTHLAVSLNQRVPSVRRRLDWCTCSRTSSLPARLQVRTPGGRGRLQSVCVSQEKLREVVSAAGV